MKDDSQLNGGVGARPGAAEGRATPIPPLPRVAGDRADPAGARLDAPPPSPAAPAGHNSADLIPALAAEASPTDRLSDALWFYADPTNWGSPIGEGRHFTSRINSGDVEIRAPVGHRLGPAVDIGRHAREALEAFHTAERGDPDPASAGALCLGG